MTLQTVSVHKARAMVLVLSILLAMIANTTFVTQYLLYGSEGDVILQRLINFSVS